MILRKCHNIGTFIASSGGNLYWFHWKRKIVFFIWFRLPGLEYRGSDILVDFDREVSIQNIDISICQLPFKPRPDRSNIIGNETHKMFLKKSTFYVFDKAGNKIVFPRQRAVKIVEFRWQRFWPLLSTVVRPSAVGYVVRTRFVKTKTWV